MTLFSCYFVVSTNATLCKWHSPVNTIHQFSIFFHYCATWKGEDCLHLCFREMEIPKFHINNFSQHFELITKVICACKNGGCMIYTDFFRPRKLEKYFLYSHVSMNYSTLQEQKSSSSECKIYRNGFCGKFYGIASQRAAL